MKTFGYQLNRLTSEALTALEELINSKGEESKHNNNKCLKVTNDEHQHNLDGDRYLTEVHSECLVDNSGYEYNYAVLSAEDLFSTIDYLIVKYKKK